jgi:hypothetical protein
MKKLACFLLALSVFWPPHVSWARHAETTIVPTRVFLENADRLATVVIKNTGDATGNYALDLVDMKMTDAGAVVYYEKGETPLFSAVPYLHIAPRSITLKPGQFQIVHIFLQKPGIREAGEYRAHLQLRVVDDDVEPAVPSVALKDGQIVVKANLVITIPVIVRNGATTLAMSIDRPILAHDANGNPAIEMYLARQGTRSSMGDISVTCAQGGGAPRVIKLSTGIAVYRPNARRFVSVPLDETPKDVNLSKCKLGIAYTAYQHDGGKKLAEAQIDAP